MGHFQKIFSEKLKSSNGYHSKVIFQTLEPSSQPASLTDTEIASLPMVQEIAQISFNVPDIVNACRELNSTLGKSDHANLVELFINNFYVFFSSLQIFGTSPGIRS